MVDKQIKKAGKLRLHAIMEGQPVEDREHWMESVDKAIKKRKDHAKLLNQDKKKLEKVACKKNNMSFDNMSVHIASNVDTPDLRRAIALHPGAVVVGAREDAGVFVTADPAKAKDKTQWCATFWGGIIVCTACVTSGHGAAVAFKPSIGTMRRLFITPSFEAEHPTFAGLIKVAAKKRGSKWRMIDSMHAFVAEFDKAKRNHRPATVALLAREGDVFDPPLPAHARVFHDPEAFLCTVSYHDSKRSSAGVAMR